MQKINPFSEKTKPIDKSFESLKKLALKPYDPKTTSPFTKVRIILMNGTEFEASWFSHQFSRHCGCNDLRRELAIVRRVEQQQQKKIASLKPISETILQHTIGYEQLAVELTAILAQKTSDNNVKNALNFALLEDFDHVYRYANLLQMDENVKAEELLGYYTEVMPARPTICEHRYPADEIKKHIDGKTADLFTKLTTHIITAAEQQTMNFYMNQANFYPNELGRNLFSEIALIEEQHVSQYGSLIDTSCTWLECLVMHEYTECYLYYSCYQDESDESIKQLWQECYLQECAHLKKASELFQKYEKRDVMELFPTGAEFPELLKFGANKEYIRKVLKETGNYTADLEDYKRIDKLDKNAPFFKYNQTTTKPTASVASHAVIQKHIDKFGKDHRYEEKQNPITSLRDRAVDNVDYGRN